ERIRVCLNQDHRGASHDSSQGHGMDQIPYPGAVRGIDRHRQAGKLIMERRNATEVQGVTRVFVRTDDAALAQNDVFLTSRHDPLDPEQIGLDVQRVPAFVNHRQCGIAQPVQQSLVLGVGLTHLNAIYPQVFVNRHIIRVEHLDYRRQVELPTRFHNEVETIAQSFLGTRTDPLPTTVGAGAVLDYSTAQGFGASRFNEAGRFHNLRLALDRAGTGDYSQFVATDLNVADADRTVNQVPGSALLGHTFICARDGNQALDTAHLLHFADRQAGD